MNPDSEVEYTFVGAEMAATVRDLMREAFGEYDSVLTVPSSAMDESVEDVAAHIAAGGALLARVNGEPIASGRFEWRDGHVYIGRLSVRSTWRRLGIGSRMMALIEEHALNRGYTEARIGVRTMLQGNLELYERLGYVTTARYKHPRGDEIIVDMAKALRP